jgi:DNA-binding NarL/FixJ family response regulator
VPAEQRNRWVEPFREGIASRESWKKGSLYPFVRHLDIGDQGRIAICSAEVLVAFAVVGVPEGTEFTDDERARLTACASELIVPLRVCAMVANAKDGGSALEELLAARADVVVLTDARGGILGESRRASDLLAREPHVRNSVVRAVERAADGPFRARGRSFFASPCVRRGIGGAYMVAIDEASKQAKKKLSARQLELIGYLERGLANAEIARAMGIAPSTVKTMLERLYKQAGVANRVELIAWSRGR